MEARSSRSMFCLSPCLSASVRDILVPANQLGLFQQFHAKPRFLRHM